MTIMLVSGFEIKYVAMHMPGERQIEDCMGGQDDSLPLASEGLQCHPIGSALFVSWKGRMDMTQNIRIFQHLDSAMLDWACRSPT